MCIDIPPGTAFQYRCSGTAPLVCIVTAMPPWPGDDEAVIIDGPWHGTRRACARCRPGSDSHAEDLALTLPLRTSRAFWDRRFESVRGRHSPEMHDTTDRGADPTAVPPASAHGERASERSGSGVGRGWHVRQRSGWAGRRGLSRRSTPRTIPRTQPLTVARPGPSIRANDAATMASRRGMPCPPRCSVPRSARS